MKMKKQWIRLGIIGATILTATSCMKKPDHTPNYGEEVANQKVLEAIDEIGTVDPVTIKKCEFVSKDTYQSIESSVPQIIQQKALTVTEVQETTTAFLFTIIKTIKKLENGTWKDPISETIKSELKKNPQSLSLQKKILILSNTDDNSIHPLGSTGTPGKYTYHNLKKEYIDYPIPSAVKDSSNCGGLARCDRPLRAIKVSFDRVYWETADRGQKTSLQFIATPDAPYFASQLSGCAQSWIDYAGRVVSVTECDEVKDFKFGDSSLEKCN